MDPLIVTLGVALLVFVLAIALMPRSLSRSESGSRLKNVLGRMRAENEALAASQDEMMEVSIAKQRQQTGPIGSLILKIPGMQAMYQAIMKSGYGHRLPVIMLIMAVIFILVSFALSKSIVGSIALGPLALGKLLSAIGGALVAYVLPYKFFRYKIRKRNEIFINNFPDAIDMIVRSVRSGHPLNTALRMITENMDPPISTEFKQVVDEVSYGRTLTDALGRLSMRIDEPDLQFFVVVLSVQQETGGNLAEVLSNLSGIIRKRKQLRLKIKAMTSEGRATAYILGALPVLEFAALYFTSPEYLKPLWETTPGMICFAIAIALVGLAGWIVSQMINIDI